MKGYKDFKKTCEKGRKDSLMCVSISMEEYFEVGFYEDGHIMNMTLHIFCL